MEWSDWVNLIVQTVAAIASVVAIVLALVAFRAAKQGEVEAQLVLARERRLDFELRVLLEIADTHSAQSRTGSLLTSKNHDDMVVRLMMLPREELPSLSFWTEVNPDPKMVYQLSDNDDQVRIEIRDAIQRRLDERAALRRP